MKNSKILKVESEKGINFKFPVLNYGSPTSIV